MAMAVEITMVIALVLSIIVPGVSFLKGQRTKSRFKSHLAVNVVTFFGLLIVATVSILAGNTSALAATASSGSGFATGMGYIAAALSVGISCIGGGIAVASAASAALGAISEDQSILGKSLIYVGLAEGVCLYGLIIAFMIIGSISDNVDTLTGMRLAGIEGVVVHEKDELKEALDKAFADTDIGILLLTEKFGREFPDVVNAAKLQHKLPLIIDVPDRHGSGRRPDFITAYVGEAIGLKL